MAVILWSIPKHSSEIACEVWRCPIGLKNFGVFTQALAASDDYTVVSCCFSNHRPNFIEHAIQDVSAADEREAVGRPRDCEICMVNKQKMSELAFLKETKSLEPTLFPGSIINSEGEKPDILMQAAERIIGIEITDYWRGRTQEKGGSAMHRSEAAQKNLAKMAHQAFKTNHSEPIFVTLHFNPQEALAKRKFEQLASTLADIVGQHIPQELYAKKRLDYSDLEGTGLESFVCSINVQRMRDDSGDGWGVASAGFISATTEELQGIINEKDPKVQEYLTRCDEVSLLIVAESFLDISGHISFSQDVLSHKYTYGLKRVLFYDRATKEVHLLKK